MYVPKSGPEPYFCNPLDQASAERQDPDFENPNGPD